MATTDLAIFQEEDKANFVAINQLLLDLGGYPTLSWLGLPGSRSNLVVMRHRDSLKSAGKFE
jgi:uncharacterized membrane-anchored protein